MFLLVATVSANPLKLILLFVLNDLLVQNLVIPDNVDAT